MDILNILLLCPPFEFAAVAVEPTSIPGGSSPLSREHWQQVPIPVRYLPVPLHEATAAVRLRLAVECRATVIQTRARRAKRRRERLPEFVATAEVLVELVAAVNVVEFVDRLKVLREKDEAWILGLDGEGL